jgi:phosphoglucomutase
MSSPLMIKRTRGAERLSGSENLYKTYVESFRGVDHLGHLQEEEQTIANDTRAAKP